MTRRGVSPARILAETVKQTARHPLIFAGPLAAAVLSVFSAAVISAAGGHPWAALSVLAAGVAALTLPLTVHATAASLHATSGDEKLTSRQLLRAASRDVPRAISALAMTLGLVSLGAVFFLAGIAVTWPLALLAMCAMMIERRGASSAIRVARTQMTFALAMWLLALTGGCALVSVLVVDQAKSLAGPAAVVLYGPVFWLLVAPPAVMTFLARR